ncbi:MAG: hypothetical protein AVO34_04780 [Firmicutes bacterium ML8_F2]|jgi:quercetin dioxygenase-like cupin family protein|nr:MAG: hypothetical protein AVO34_04780 [Firmicutes bacterium ML8_F2]
MYTTDLKKTEEIDITPDNMKEKGRVTVRWLLGEPEGAPNFEMRYFSLMGDVTTDWHSHDWEHEVFIVAGKGKCRSEDGERDLKPGDAVFVAPGEQHHFICGGEKLDFICVVPQGTRAL